MVIIGFDSGDIGGGSFLASLPRTSSMDSTSSFFSVGHLSQKSESISDLSTSICNCDDCLLGITDALADLVLWNSSNTIQYASIDENTAVDHESVSRKGSASQRQFTTNEKVLKRKVSLKYILHQNINQPYFELDYIPYHLSIANRLKSYLHMNNVSLFNPLCIQSDSKVVKVH